MLSCYRFRRITVSCANNEILGLCSLSWCFKTYLLDLCRTSESGFLVSRIGRLVRIGDLWLWNSNVLQKNKRFRLSRFQFETRLDRDANDSPSYGYRMHHRPIPSHLRSYHLIGSQGLPPHFALFNCPAATAAGRDATCNVSGTLAVLRLLYRHLETEIVPRHSSSGNRGSQ